MDFEFVDYSWNVSLSFQKYCVFSGDEVEMHNPSPHLPITFASQNMSWFKLQNPSEQERWLAVKRWAAALFYTLLLQCPCNMTKLLDETSTDIWHVRQIHVCSCWKHWSDFIWSDCSLSWCFSSVWTWVTVVTWEQLWPVILVLQNITHTHAHQHTHTRTHVHAHRSFMFHGKTELIIAATNVCCLHLWVFAIISVSMYLFACKKQFLRIRHLVRGQFTRVLSFQRHRFFMFKSSRYLHLWHFFMRQWALNGRK